MQQLPRQPTSRILAIMRFVKKKTKQNFIYCPAQKSTSETLLIHLVSGTIEEREREERDERV